MRTNHLHSFAMPFLAVVAVVAVADDKKDAFGFPVLARNRGFGGYGQEMDKRSGPYNANSTTFLNAVETSNATGIFKIPGYDVSKPYPGEPMDGWTLSMAALDFSKVDEKVADEYQPMLGFSLRIKAPDPLIKAHNDGTKIVNTHSSWGMCLWNFHQPGSTAWAWNNPDNKPLAEDGSCKGFLSDDCIAALEKTASKSYYVAESATADDTPYRTRVRCLPLEFEELEVCRGMDPGGPGPGNTSWVSPSSHGVAIPYLNGSVTSSGGWLFMNPVWTDSAYGYKPEDLPQMMTDFWDSQQLNYWPIVTLFVNATMDPNTPRENGSGVRGWSSGSMRHAGGSIPRVQCVAPNGMGTGKSWTFSGKTSPNANSISLDKIGNNGDDKGSSASKVISLAKRGVWMASASSLLLVLQMR
ncbi:hypothetical protein VTI74DRAFT_6504 [Chaetomium olivicolor]